jgi:hypothetical protein
MSDTRVTRLAAGVAVLRSATRSERALTLFGAAVVAVVLCVTLVLPYLETQHRIATEVPQPYPLVETSLVELQPRQQGCADEIGLLPGLQVAQMRIGTFGKPPAPLELRLIAPGYREDVAVPAASYHDNGLLEVPFRGPVRPLDGNVCVANHGHVRVALYAAAETAKSRSTTVVGGRLWPSNFDLAFYATRRENLIEAKGAILRRALLFHAHVGINVLRLLVLLLVVGVPLATVAAVALPARRTPNAGRSG